MTDLKKAASNGIELMDLTTLNLDDTNEIVTDLCHKAITQHGNTAAVCIYPQFISAARKALSALPKNNIRIATVTNFPHGSDDIELAVNQTRIAVANGADEVDVVFPYRAFLAGDNEIGHRLVEQCKAACGPDAILKVILETGEIKTPELIKQASLIAINAGADFIKTSTGKVAVNATLEAAEQMLLAIKETGAHCGFKAAGGVKNAQDVADYTALASDILSPEWVSPAHFRFGASSLLDNLLQTLNGQVNSADNAGY